jgi:hypothetical protein
MEGLEVGGDYAIRVANLRGSEAATFQLRVLIPTPPPEPPGKRLPDKGVSDEVDRLLNPADAYWTRMRAGRTMRLSLQTDRCVSLEVHAPGTDSFAEAPVRSLGCGGYGLFTPDESGRHFLVVRAERGRAEQRYVLRVAPARRDDTVPGILLRNHSKAKGRVNGGIDTRDLYRFDVRRRSALSLSLRGGPEMTLVREDGRRMGRGDIIERNIAAGRYYVAVEGAGKYTLRRLSRTITRASLEFDGQRSATIRPRASARLTLSVRPRTHGKSVITVDRFDPIEGWQFLRTYRPDVRRGTASVRFSPPSVGRYRASGTFRGSRNAAPDDAPRARLRVERPLKG